MLTSSVGFSKAICSLIARASEARRTRSWFFSAERWCANCEIRTMSNLSRPKSAGRKALSGYAGWCRRTGGSTSTGSETVCRISCAPFRRSIRPSISHLNQQFRPTCGGFLMNPGQASNPQTRHFNLAETRHLNFGLTPTARIIYLMSNYVNPSVCCSAQSL
jgi:hypothetical protein